MPEDGEERREHKEVDLVHRNFVAARRRES